MVQPKKPPVSIRFPDDLMERVDAWATDHGLARNAALKALVELGLLRPLAPPAVKPAATPEKVAKAARPAKPAAAIKQAAHDPKAAASIVETWGKPQIPAVQLGPAPAKPGSRLKGAKK